MTVEMAGLRTISGYIGNSKVCNAVKQMVDLVTDGTLTVQ